MRRLLFWCYFAFLLLWSRTGHAQDFSNKGNDFWVGYGYHAMMGATNDGGSQQMVLYFATEAVTNVTVSIPGLGYTVTYPNIAANTVFPSGPLPKAGGQDARLTSESISAKGIHITSDRPIVAYAHIYDGNVSGATLLFPTATLGKEYYSVNYTQVSNYPLSNGWVYAVAVDTGTTVVQITPSANTLTHAAGVPFTVNLTQGQVVNLLGQLDDRNTQPYTGVDLTGTTIKSISSGTAGCKRIAVFSGSGKLSITCDGSSGTSDNYMVQAFPKTAWGKRYLTVPTKDFANNFFRICVTDPATVVKVNGSVLSGLQGNFYYETNTTAPALVEADKPILVAQYITSQGACGNATTLGDPEVIYLSPVEQNIDKVLLNSTRNFDIKQHYINVVMPTAALPSFRVDGNPVSGFAPHPQDATYSYAQISVGPGKHSLQADSGFNAVAYGYGEFESYGFNAGTNVKDLYQFVSVENQYATVNFPAACKSSPFRLSMTFPYQPAQIKWIFGSDLNNMGLADVSLNAPAYDSTWMVNGKQLYRYRLPAIYNVAAIGTYPIRILAQNPTNSEGCSGEQEIDYDVQVYDRPLASLAYVSSGCVSDSVYFSDQSNLDGRSAIRWNWNLGDGDVSSKQNPTHLYKTAGSFPVQFSLISDIGCVSDTAAETIFISQPPVAKFGVLSSACAAKAIQFSDSSSTAGVGLQKWIWNFGDNTPDVVATSGAAQTHTYAAAGTYTATLQVESAGGCKSFPFTRQITVSVGPVVDFSFDKACLPVATVQFTNLSTISDGSQAQLLYRWDFGDGGTATTKDPTHDFKSAGPFVAKLVVTTAAGCQDSASKSINTIYESPVAKFTAPGQACLATVVNFSDGSTAPNSSVAEWEWDFGDGSPFDTQQSPSHTYAKAGTYTATLKVHSAVGCTSSLAAQTIVINPLPVADFNIANSACEKANLSFTNISSAGTSTVSKATWDFGDGAISDLLTPTHTYQQTGNYSVSLSVETDAGCKSSPVSKQITVHPAPKVGFIVPGTCVNDPVSVFADTTTISDGSQSNFQWLWNFGDQNALPANNSSTIKDAQHHYTAAGNYNVSLTVTSKDGCASSLIQTLTVNGAVPVPDFFFANNATLCSNSPVSVTDNSSVSPGRLVKAEIYWDYNNDPSNKTTVNNPVKGASYPHIYNAFNAPAEKDYRVKFVVYSGQNCLTQKDTTIAILAVPDVQFTAPPSVCANATAFLLNAVANPSSGTGTFSGDGVAANGLFNPAVAGAGSHLIRYSYQATNGCTAVNEQTVAVRPVPVVSAGPDKAILVGGSAVLNGKAEGNGLQYVWSPAAGLSSATVLQPVASPAVDATYTLSVTSAEGCTASDQVLVKVLKAPVVPNAFSPNGDGVHDTWQIDFLDSYPGTTVEIFNRYGQKVFESKGYPKPWDGTLNGKALPIGTYYYVIDPRNNRKPLTGFVDIIR